MPGAKYSSSGKRYFRSFSGWFHDRHHQRIHLRQGTQWPTCTASADRGEGTLASFLHCLREKLSEGLLYRNMILRLVLADGGLLR